jgi:hypothetical protein
MPSLGIIIGLPVTAILLIAAAITFLYFRRYSKICHKADRAAAIGFKWVSVAVAVIVAAIAAVTFWPWKWQYHSWQTTSGTIQTVSKRLVSTGDKTMEERYVVQFSDGRQRACDDTRCSLLHPGMTLTLRCKRAYQWGATPGYDCNYVGARS